ncbi:unnamed protein product [Moneuplotes crassus]|uniref:Protein kinase domain-containing protein n=2 Tax=Euplotes crassus TaxID=5936 RepID=A0AAD1UGM4_EUPCR|nr:unnamed protein product [Moneuplotes crassus]
MGNNQCSKYFGCGGKKNNYDTIQLNKLKLVGVGAFGRVWAVELVKYTSEKETFTDNDSDDMVYALKELSKPIIIAKEAVNVANNEVKILQDIPNSKFIVNIWYSFQDQKNAYVLMDYAPCGDLLFHMKRIKRRQIKKDEKGGTLTEHQGKFMAMCVLEALRTIHEAGVVHRDIKPENIIIDSNGYPKLADFGIAEFNENISPGSQFGTLSYMAPEIIFDHKYSYTADYYSLGVLILLMVTGDMLSVGGTPKEAKNAISLRNDSITTKKFTKRYPYLSEECCDLIVSLLCTSQHKRIGVTGGVEEILKHEWFEGIEIESIKNQSYVSPIYEICTDQKAIMELTSNDYDRGESTSFWRKKENKAMKMIAKAVDYGNNWESHFTAFDYLNVIFEDEDNPFEKTERVRRHTMSSISKQRNGSLSDIIERDKLRAELSNGNEENPKPRMGLHRISEPKSEQGGKTITPTNERKSIMTEGKLSPDDKVDSEKSPEKSL